MKYTLRIVAINSDFRTRIQVIICKLNRPECCWLTVTRTKLTLKTFENCTMSSSRFKTSSRSAVGVSGLTPKSLHSFTTPQHAATSKSAYIRSSLLQTPSTAPVKSMRMLGKENEDLQQHIRELSEALKSSHESKNILVANHEVAIEICPFISLSSSYIVFTACDELKDRRNLVPT